jgi:small subunit ribosomal protein S17
MADEEKKNEENTEETEQPKAEEAKAEEAAEEKAEEAPAAEPAGDAAPADAGDGEEGEKPTPKQLRKRERSTFKGKAADPRTPEQRAAARTELRQRKAKQRRSWRAKRRQKAAATQSGPASTPAPETEAGKRKTRQGIVVSSKAEKTITVQIDNVRRHRTYGKVLRETTTLHAHDESNEAGEGDTVRVIECRPLSRLKRWRLVEVLEKAK